MNYRIKFLMEALGDMEKLDNSIRPQIMKGIQKVSTNPVSIHKGGYGKPLGNRDGTNLAHLYKIKFLSIGIRVIYALQEQEQLMTIIIVSVRADNQVYIEANRRRDKHHI